jgi:hypothetical protein
MIGCLWSASVWVTIAASWSEKPVGPSGTGPHSPSDAARLRSSGSIVSGSASPTQIWPSAVTPPMAVAPDAVGPATTTDGGRSVACAAAGSSSPADSMASSADR